MIENCCSAAQFLKKLKLRCKKKRFSVVKITLISAKLSSLTDLSLPQQITPGHKTFEQSNQKLIDENSAQISSVAENLILDEGSGVHQSSLMVRRKFYVSRSPNV